MAYFVILPIIQIMGSITKYGRMPRNTKMKGLYGSSKVQSLGFSGRGEEGYVQGRGD
jgi:hypothetical protein